MQRIECPHLCVDIEHGGTQKFRNLRKFARHAETHKQNAAMQTIALTARKVAKGELDPVQLTALLGNERIKVLGQSPIARR